MCKRTPKHHTTEKEPYHFVITLPADHIHKHHVDVTVETFDPQRAIEIAGRIYILLKEYHPNPEVLTFLP